ncbi:rho-type GTPase-activating protein-like protein 2 [Massarina eburnea CBS 473.64]|uniref:Rho-type GTPase-activating protein-like protein 2 n=1 Tax=Massarina eburnea CBS 473.64 TaxID=1395130 RepID=A0A6A6RWP2_9PLEO|nr:rho-type GTPase-activating protein-like protein 2 [Massarina eburnea CBS 473.64]
MESPGGYPESPTDQDDVVYPCKGCGEILEEGKAFELAGNRWHIDCFRCNTCGTLLDSDANLLLLGDGSLICNNCTYSCNHCGNKIEDLAILTGDQAFCANCFRCRNCKRKIENLRYARTSQGIFCMGCHESLMARRRKKTKKPPASIAPKVDKSLPALPPNAAQGQTQQQFTPDLDTPSDVYSEATATDSPRPSHPRRNDSSPAANFRRDASPVSLDDHRKNHSISISTNIYKEMSQSEADDTGDDMGILLPFALDPNTAPGPSPNSGKSHTRAADSKPGRDYFNRPSATTSREVSKENRSRSVSEERSPHIAFQEKGRQQSEQPLDTLRKRKESNAEPPASNDRTRNQHASPPGTQPSEAFKLQEVPKSKKAEARKNSVASSPSHASSATDKTGNSLAMTPPGNDAHTRDDSPATSGSSYNPPQRVERPARGDSLANATHRPPPSSSRKDVSASSPTTPTMPQSDRKPSISSARQPNGGYSITSPSDSHPTRSLSDPPIPPQRSADRRPPPSADTFVSPRAPPQPPPPPQNQRMSDPASAGHETMSPGGLPRYSAQGDFSQDEDFARLLMNQDGQDGQGGVLRRVSNAMTKHSRSFSDRGSINQRGHKKWPTNGSIDISSPTMPSPDSKEESANLRNELRRTQQKIAELEAEKNGLQESVHNAADLKQANTMLREKRNTMAVLDSQREMVIRELEIMTDHLKRAKESGNSVDYNLMKSEIIKDFANALQKLKDQMGGQIEDLIGKRTALTDEISNLIQMKDKGFQEYESLSAQNKKLSDMNQNLIESIQGMLHKNKQANGNLSADAGRSPANGLGIYNTHHKAGKSEISFDSQQTVIHEHSYNNLHEADSEAILAQPQIVSVRKGKPTTKFSNWKKGGQAMKNVTKGFKGAFAPSESRQDEYNNAKVIGTPYGSTHTQPDLASLANVAMPSTLNKGKEDPNAARNWFTGTGKPGGNRQDPRFKPAHGNGSSSNIDSEQPPSILFGSDLSSRCDYEKRMIPAIISRCIQEVETRGMDVEGIYRKSGGSSQVNQVKTGFAEDDEYDISDPDLDIHAVTSALKAYLRRLPGPLIPYEVYDEFLQAGAQETTPAKAKALHAALQSIPRAHYDCIQFLVFHLSRVIQHSKENLMTPLNIAVVFAPTILRPEDVQRELTDMNIQRDAVQALLENHKNIFFDED